MPDEIRAKQLIAELGVAIPRSVRATSVDELLEAAADVPGPWALKVAAEGILHKAAEGLLVLGLTDQDELAAAAERLAPRLEGYPDGAFLLEHQHEVLGELFLGCSLDPHFGPVIGLGRGGSDVEEVAAVTWATCPLDAAGAERLLAAPPVAGMIDRLTADGPVLEQLTRTIVAVSRWFATSSAEAQELEINPLAIVRGDPGLVALDAVVRLPAGT